MVQSTAVINVADEGFTGWFSEAFTFTATATSQLLSFLAIGTPQGLPPFALLDGVTVEDATPAPEPAALALLGLGLAAVVFGRSRRR